MTFLHITETFQDWRPGAGWQAYCRCGWTTGWLLTQRDARTQGEAHLAEGNARPVGAP